MPNLSLRQLQDISDQSSTTELPSDSKYVKPNDLDLESPQLRKREELLVKLRSKITETVKNKLLTELRLVSLQQLQALVLLSQMTDRDPNSLESLLEFRSDYHKSVGKILEMVKYPDLSDSDKLPLDSMVKRLLIRIHNKCEQILQFVKIKDMETLEIYEKNMLSIIYICNNFLKANDWAKGTITMAINATLIPNELTALPDPFIGLE